MGKIIVIEGTDGSGKNTQAKKLFEKLKSQGEMVEMFSFPNYKSGSSKPVRMYLAGEIVKDANQFDAYQSSTLFAVDRVISMKEFEPFLKMGGTLILDRYVQSNMIHQAGKIDNLKERDAFLEWINDFEFGKLKLPKVDQVFFLDVPISVTKKLIEERQENKSGGSKDIHEQDMFHLEKAYQAGKYVSKKFNWIEINCTKDDKILSIDEIHNKIMQKVNSNEFAK